jgi:hypothetical protein
VEFLALPGLEALLRLVNDIDAALATHEAVVAMAVTQGFQRITDFHDITKRSSRAGVNPRRMKMNALYASNRRPDQERAGRRLAVRRPAAFFQTNSAARLAGKLGPNGSKRARGGSFQ